MADELNTEEPSIADTAMSDLAKGRVLLEAHINRLMSSLNSRQNQTFDPVWLRAAQGFLTPTKTGGFGESLGNVAGGVAEEQSKQKANEQSNLEAQFKLSQLKYGMDKENAQQDFLSHYGEPNATRKIPVVNNVQQPVPPQEGATVPNFETQPQEQQYKDEKYYDPHIDLKRAVQTGVLPYEKYLELTTKDKDKFKLLSDAEAKAAGFDVTGGRKWKITANGPEIVPGSKPEADTSDFALSKAMDKLDSLKKNNIDGVNNSQIRTLENYIQKESTRPPKEAQPVDEESVQSTIEMIGTGQMQMPSISRSTPFWQSVVKGLHEQYPDFHAVDFNTVKQNEVAFTKGKQGDIVRSLNVTINHADTFRDLIKNINNTNLPVWNSLANEFQKQTGQSAPTNFDAMKGVLADEMAKGILGSAGALADRQSFAANLNKASSPKQLNEALDTYVKALGGQLAGMAKQYHAGTNKNDFADRFLYDRTIGAIPEASMLITESIKSKKPVISSDDEDLIKKHLKKKS
jgi:hypothetical protein